MTSEPRLREEDGGIGPRLRKFRKSCDGCSTQKDFAAALGIDQQRLSGYENGTRVPHHVLAAFVRMGANPYWILFGEGPMRGATVVNEAVRDAAIHAVNMGDADPDERQLAEFYVFPLYAEETAAAQPRDRRDVEIEGPTLIHRVWCPHPDETDCIRAHATGESMTPTIPAGAMVAVDRSETDPERLTGKVVAVAPREGGVAFKRLQRDGRGGYVGVPDNPAAGHPATPLAEGDRIVGQATVVYTRLS